MAAFFLIRMDDICPTMNWAIWNQIENIFDKYSIKPILAIVPDNHDPALQIDNPNNEFWMRARDWQRKGWTIGLHGYRHKYETSSPGVIGLNNRSEFAGVPFALQTERISKGIAIMNSHGVFPSIWVAPAHSFDECTIAALIESGIKVLSDGFYFRPITNHGVLWIPQQLWRFRPFSFGLWTICYHQNIFDERRLLAFEADILRYQLHITSVDDVLSMDYPNANATDHLIAKLWLRLIKAKRWIKAL